MPLRSSVTAHTSGTTHASADSVWVPLNQYNEPFDVGFGVTLTTTALVSGSFYSVQHTFDDLFQANASARAFDHSAVSGANASQDGSYTEPVAAVRVVLRGTKASVASVSGQDATLTILQTGY